MLEQFPITKSVVGTIINHPATPDVLLLGGIVIATVAAFRFGYNKLMGNT